MTLKTVIAAAGAAVVLFAAAGAQAAQAVPPASTAAAQSANPEAEALVRRYLAAIHFERNMDSMLTAMLPVIASQSARNSQLSAEDRQMIVDVTRRVMREKMMPQMLDRMIPVYAATFSMEELRALVTFYEGPVGRAITDKMPSLAPKSAEITRELMPTVLQEVLTEVIARKCPGGKCDAAKLPRPAAS